MTIRTTTLRSGAVAVAVAVALLVPVVATAHAELLETSPADGATVEGTPPEISAQFSEALEADGAGISLLDPAGEEVADGGLDPDDPARLLIADVPDLAPGDYEVQMTVVTDDGHIERETWTFTVVAAPTPSPSPTPTATASDAPTAEPSATSAPSPTPAPSAVSTPSASPGPDEDPASSTSDVILPIVAVLAIVVVGVGVLMSRRNSAT